MGQKTLGLPAGENICKILTATYSDAKTDESTMSLEPILKAYTRDKIDCISRI